MVSSTCGRHASEMREERSQNRKEARFTFAYIRFRSQNGCRRRLMIVCEDGVEQEEVMLSEPSCTWIVNVNDMIVWVRRNTASHGIILFGSGPAFA